MNSATGGLIRRMLLATGALLLIVGCAFGVLLISIGVQRETARMSRHSQAIFTTVDQVNRLASEMQAAQLQFTTTRDTRFLDRWQAAQTGLPVQTARLEGLASTPQQRDQAGQIARTTDSYVHDYSIPAVDAARRGDPTAWSVASVQEGGRRIDQLHAELDSLRGTEQTLINTRDRETDAMADREITAVVTGMVGCAIVIALVGWYQTRVMVQPIRRAAVMADRLAGGDLGTRMPETGKAEIGQLERSFNIMAASLEHNHRDLARLADAQTALRRVATLVARGSPPDEVLASVAEELGRLIGTETARILRYDPDGRGTVVAAWRGQELDLPVGRQVPIEGRTVAALVLHSGRAARMDCYRDADGWLAAHLRERGIRSAVGAPIHIEGHLWGVVIATTLCESPVPPDAEARLAEYTDLIATAIANTQARADLVASRARLVVATDQARRRIERDLHDGVQQRLISLALEVRRAESAVPPELTKVRKQLSGIVGELTDTVDDVRELSRGVHPAILTEGGLRPALNALARRSPVAVELDVRLKSRLPEPVEVAAYYVVAEALANAAKHAHASFVSVSASVADGRLHLTVGDDGVGGAEPGRGSGLVGLTDRVEALGGSMTLESPVDGGTRLRVALPLNGTSSGAGAPPEPST
ncbi:hypothetical protein GCM10010399_65260 [Dactylosporangium fulvum]|uniref:histidine kinase n=1 Tax=Dactylosporangium fulvum TaxID=53359 RepID=A0ABY5VMF6_9ACTN|nr:HAMP domain-containing protein [Dactylosporangium fulvum]UWP78857.1 HAMP domain-containing protein [Dactylosporangium fulvum]